LYLTIQLWNFKIKTIHFY